MKFEYLPEVNELQLYILIKLTTSPSGLKFSQLRPDNEEIENDLFNYHLQYLVKNELVSKQEQVYQITDKGVQLTTNVDALGNIKTLFKVSVTPYVVNHNKILVQKRLRHPFYGDISSVAGKVMKGELIEQAAKRKMKEETDLKAEFKLIGVYRKIRRKKESRILEDTFYHVCVADKFSGELEEKNVFGENFWTTFEQAIEFQKQNIDSGPKDIEIMQRIRDRNFDWFYFQDEIVVDKY